MAAPKDEAGPGEERQIVARLLGVAASAGLAVDLGAVINLYVALKSKPLMLLAGPSQTGKVALVQCLAMALTGGSSWQRQFMPGHAWWVSQSGNVGLFTEAQTRLNTGKILALIEEAGRPENCKQVLMACLHRISPAELEGFFAGTAFQLQRGDLLWLPVAHLSEPVILPPNLNLTGTIDADAGAISDAGMMPKTSVIRWSGSPVERPRAPRCRRPTNPWSEPF